MKTKKQEYCVHILPVACEVENILAKTPQEAERIAMQNASFDYEDVSHVEVMRVHHCNEDEATDNDITNTHCSNCGKKL